MELTIIIPCYNEEKTIKTIIDKIFKLKQIKFELILVNDGSTDKTDEQIRKSVFFDRINYLKHERNLGKGAAIITAKKYISGQYVIIQDGDLEYDPNDIIKILNIAKSLKYKAVYGSRVLNKTKYQNYQNYTHFIRILGNDFLTKLNNLINNQNLTDAHTCYKLIDADIFKNINLIEKGFNFCPEITCKLSNLNIKIKEVEINYKGRSYTEGKKISSIDGLRAIAALVKYGVLKLN